MYKLAGRIALVALGVTLLGPATARADDDDGTKEKPQPRVMRIKVLERDVRKQDGPKQDKDGQTRRDPMDAVGRWAMKHLAGYLAQVGDGSAKTPLHAWFDGGPDVPLADLRDAWKADGWTADDLMAWFQRHALRALHGAMSHMAGRRDGQPAGGAAAGFPGRGPRSGAMHGGAIDGGAVGGFAGRHGTGMGGGRRWGPGFGPPPWMRGGMQPGQGPFGQGGQGPQGMPWGGFAPGGAAPSSRTIILWNDGSGWQRREIPGGAAQGMGPGPWMGGMHGGPGAGAPPPGHPPMAAPQDDARAKWRALHKRVHEAPGAKDAQQGTLGPWFELLEQLMPEGMVPPAAVRPAPPGQRRMRVKVIRSLGGPGGKDVVIEESVEEEKVQKPPTR